MGHAARKREPAEPLVGGESLVAEGAQHTLQHRRARSVPLGDQHGQAVHQQIGRSQRLRCRRRGTHGHGDLQHSAATRQTASGQRRVERVSVGLAGRPEVERLQAFCGLEQQRRSVAVPGGERDLTAQQVDPGALELVQWSRLRRREQCERRIGRARVGLCLRRRQGALRPSARRGRQLGGAFEERGSCGQTAARLRSACRTWRPRLGSPPHRISLSVLTRDPCVIDAPAEVQNAP
jgi:hypothetical protein